MTAVVSLLAATPRLRPDVTLGPPLLAGAAVTHAVKDQRIGLFYRIGPKEHFIASRLDGRRSLAQIGDEYTLAYGRRLDEARWQQILGQFAGRRLLVGTDTDAALEQLAAAARDKDRAARTILHRRLPLFDPDRFLGRVEPLLRWAFARWFVVPALLVLAAMTAVIAANGAILYRDAGSIWSTAPLAGVAAIVVIWLTVALHELAHGLTCKHYGGSAPEIGVLWRFPLLSPYCKADDVVLFAGRWHRVATAFAGVFVNLLAVVPFCLLWLVTAPGGDPHRFAAFVTLYGGAFALINLVPFLRLDGYFMLGYALGMQNLRGETYRYWAGVLRLRPVAGPQPRSAVVAYVVYGVTSLVFTVSVVVLVIGSWYARLNGWFGPLAALGVLAALALSITTAITLHRRRTP